MRVTIIALVAGGLLLAGCGGGDDSADEGAESAAETTTADGMTVPGTVLELGQPATVEYTPISADPGAEPISQIEVAVTRVKAGSIRELAQFTLPDRAKSAGVYYVDASVENVGDGNLSGDRLVLYGKVSDTLVVPPVTFGSTFGKCNYQPFPKKFTNGAKAQVCMVMLAPDKGMISEIQWRAPDDAEPISWPAS
jgi:hypothetical protein